MQSFSEWNPIQFSFFLQALSCWWIDTDLQSNQESTIRLKSFLISPFTPKNAMWHSAWLANLPKGATWHSTTRAIWTIKKLLKNESRTPTALNCYLTNGAWLACFCGVIDAHKCLLRTREVASPGLGNFPLVHPWLEGCTQTTNHCPIALTLLYQILVSPNPLKAHILDFQYFCVISICPWDNARKLIGWSWVSLLALLSWIDSVKLLCSRLINLYELPKISFSEKPWYSNHSSQ